MTLHAHNACFSLLYAFLTFLLNIFLMNLRTKFLHSDQCIVIALSGTSHLEMFMKVHQAKDWSMVKYEYMWVMERIILYSSEWVCIYKQSRDKNLPECTSHTSWYPCQSDLLDVKVFFRILTEQHLFLHTNISVKSRHHNIPETMKQYVNKGLTFYISIDCCRKKCFWHTNTLTCSLVIVKK